MGECLPGPAVGLEDTVAESAAGRGSEDLPGLLWSPLRPRQGQGLEVHEEEVELVGPLH